MGTGLNRFAHAYNNIDNEINITVTCYPLEKYEAEHLMIRGIINYLDRQSFET